MKIAVFCLIACGVALLLGDLMLGLRNSRYNQLIGEYECGYLSDHPCEADFDGDGRFTHIEVNRRSDAAVELPPRFNGAEPNVVLNTFSLDNTARTHVGVRKESNGDRLIVYDGTRSPGRVTPINVVYAWNDNHLTETVPTELDEEILSAMATHDDAGTFDHWVAYNLLIWPCRLVYSSLFIGSALLYRKVLRVQGLKAVRT